MNCHNCGTAFAPPTTRQEPRLHCKQCGTRLFAWLGDHFGTRDAVAQPPLRPRNSAPRRSTGSSSEATLILFGIFILLAFFSCACLSVLQR
jgi:predicted  nucleic acid-binding Zn-ribbon protein